MRIHTQFLLDMKSARHRLAALPQKVQGGITAMMPLPGKHNHFVDDTTSTNKADTSGFAVSPDLFQHLSIPAEDKHNQFNRSSSGSVTRRPSGEIPDLPRHISADSKTSRISKRSGRSNRSMQRPGPSSCVGNAQMDEDDTSEDEVDHDEHAFDHPSTFKEQCWIWIPRDILGLSAMLVKDLKDVGIEASDDGAVMDDRGVVQVLRNPPDEEWERGKD